MDGGRVRNTGPPSRDFAASLHLSVGERARLMKRDQFSCEVVPSREGGMEGGGREKERGRES